MGGHARTAKLTASDGTALGGVAISGDTIVAGAPGEHDGANRDRRRLRLRPTCRSWRDGTQSAVLNASDGAADDVLGSGVGDLRRHDRGRRARSQLAARCRLRVRQDPGRLDGRHADGRARRPRRWRSGLGGADRQRRHLRQHDRARQQQPHGRHAHESGPCVRVRQAGRRLDRRHPGRRPVLHRRRSGDLFGFAVAVSADTVVVGAPRRMVGRRGLGAAYVFTEPPFGWVAANDARRLGSRPPTAPPTIASLRSSGSPARPSSPGRFCIRSAQIPRRAPPTSHPARLGLVTRPRTVS